VQCTKNGRRAGGDSGRRDGGPGQSPGQSPLASPLASPGAGLGGQVRLWLQITSAHKNIYRVPVLFIKPCGDVLRRKPTATSFAARYAQDQGKGQAMNVSARHAYFFEDLEIGMEASFAKSVSEADIVAFAEVTGDKNPVHLDGEYAAKTIFKRPIAHGMLTAGYISAVFGMELPGPGAIYVSQTLNFRAPVRTGDRVVAKVRVMELYPAKCRARFACICSVGATVVLEGEAVLMVPARANGKAA
jgi:3-hydroxybutyryl-CoA dehydratase